MLKLFSTNPFISVDGNISFANVFDRDIVVFFIQTFDTIFILESFVCFPTFDTIFVAEYFVCNLYLCVKEDNNVANDFIKVELNNVFQDKSILSKTDLFNFFLRFDQKMHESTFRWRLHDLKQRKVITALSKKWFTLEYKPNYLPQLNKTENAIAKIVKDNFRGMKYCIWPTRLLQDFMLHQPGRSIILVEVEPAAAESVFHTLKDNKINDVFLKPGEIELSRYVFEATKPVIVQNLITKSPMQYRFDSVTTTIEKMIVDIFTDKKLFSAYQGSELSEIINQAYDRYAINFTTLMSYATRRKKADELTKFLKEQTYIPHQLLHD